MRRAIYQYLAQGKSREMIVYHDYHETQAIKLVNYEKYVCIYYQKTTSILREM